MQLHYFSRYASLAESTRKRIRLSGFSPSGHPLWTQKEDSIVRRYYPDFDKLMKRLPGRSYRAILARSQLLNVARKKKVWLASEISRLRRVYGRQSREELQALFPGFSHKRIHRKAKEMGLVRSPEFKRTPFPIIDQIKQRCRYLNLTMRDLDEMAKTKSYFSQAKWTGRSKINSECVRRAVEALDGRLEAKWTEYDDANAVALRTAA